MFDKLAVGRKALVAIATVESTGARRITIRTPAAMVNLTKVVRGKETITVYAMQVLFFASCFEVSLRALVFVCGRNIIGFANPTVFHTNWNLSLHSLFAALWFRSAQVCFVRNTGGFMGVHAWYNHKRELAKVAVKSL